MQNDSIDNIRLDLNKEKCRYAIYVRQGDTLSRTIHCTLASGGTVYSLENAVIVSILINKTDGTQCDNGCVVVGNEIQYTLRSNDIAAVGDNKAQFQVTFSDGTVVTSPEFSIYVYDKVVSQEYEASTNEYTSLTEQVVMAQQYAATAESASASASESASSASDCLNTIESIQESVEDSKNDAESAATSAEESAESASESATSAQQIYDTMGNSYIYIGEDEPTSALGWFNPEAGTEGILCTVEQMEAYVDEHGGSGGTSNYNSLSNKPTINSVELTGNKTTSDLGITIPTNVSELTNDSEFTTMALVEAKGYQTEDQVTTLINTAITEAINGEY